MFAHLEKTLCFTWKNISFHHMKTDCFSLLEQTVSLYLNKVFIAVN